MTPEEKLDYERRTYEVVAVGKTIELRLGPLDDPYTTMVMSRAQCLNLSRFLKEKALRIPAR